MDDYISRQMAIKAIEDLQDCYNGFSDTYDKACIIGVLEELPSAQPNTSNTLQSVDTVSRQAAIDAVDETDWYHQAEDGEMVQGAKDADQAWYKADDVYKALQGVPSSYVMVMGARHAGVPLWERDVAIARLKKLGYSLGEKIRHGHWTLQTDKNKKLYGWHICSECGAYIGEPTNYCSNCGAHMEGSER